MNSYYSGVSAGIYTTGSVDVCQYYLDNSRVYIIMVDDQRDCIDKIMKVTVCVCVCVCYMIQNYQSLSCSFNVCFHNLCNNV